MFEALEKLNDRRTVSPGEAAPVRVRTLADIKLVLAAVAPETAPTPSVTVSATVQSEDENGVRTTQEVSAETRSQSKRELLLAGFELLRKQRTVVERRQAEAMPIRVNGRAMTPPAGFVDNDAVCFVDPLVRRWTGGQRRGLLIEWDLQDGFLYRYDIFEHKLTRVVRAANA